METDTALSPAEAAMEAQGIDPTMPVQADYFGFEETHTVHLPDGVSWVQHRTMTEGDRRKYTNNVSREVRLAKQTGDAILKMQTGEERYALLLAAITGWNLVRWDARTETTQPIPFNEGNLRQFLDKADPKVIDLIHKDVMKNNPWLMQEMSVEDIDQQIEELKEMREIKVKEEEGKAS